MSDIRGLDPQGLWREVAVTSKGDIHATSRLFKTDLMTVPGIGTAAAYTAADAFGTKFNFPVPTEGVISTVIFVDRDDEGIEKELVLFHEDFTATADTAAFAVTDNDLGNLVGVIHIETDDYFDWSSNRVAVVYPALYYIAPDGLLYGQFVTRGTDNIAVGALPSFQLVIS